ncbi:MAG TPA: hypothetical protein VHA11_01510 [Bryobacteraceae bacterium]|nr:hypothetical protein [Bryobacteraceae bacterium]
MNTLSKLVLLGFVTLAGLAIWLLPKTRLVTGRQIGERVFVATYAAGVFCGAGGLLVLFAWPGRVREWHLWELSLAPLVLLYAYWLAVMRKARSSHVMDEKQDADLAKAGALAWGLSIPAMMLAFQLYQAGLFDPALWFPYYVLVTLLLHSAGTLYYFKRA